MTRKKLFGIIQVVSLGLVLLVSSGCGSAGSQQAAAKDVVIGFTGPLSGPGASYGEDVVNGLDMGVNAVNAAGGITVGGQKYMLKLVKLDDQGDNTKEKENAQRMVSEDHAIAILDPYDPSPLLTLDQNKGNEFIALCYDSIPNITQENNKLVVATPPSFITYDFSMCDIAWNQGWRKAGVLITSGPYGDVWRSAFKGYWTSKGGQVTADQVANYYTQTDFNAQLSTVLATHPDFLAIGGPSETTALVIKQARDLGFKGGFFLIDQAKMDVIAKILGGTALMGTTVGVGTVQDLPTSSIVKFTKTYESIYKVPVTWEAALNYTTVFAVAKAMELAGSVTDAYAIRNSMDPAFASLSGDKFPCSYFGVAPNGRCLIPGFTEVVKDGKYTQPTLWYWWAKSQDQVKQLMAQGLYLPNVQGKMIGIPANLQ